MKVRVAVILFYLACARAIIVQDPIPVLNTDPVEERKEAKAASLQMLEDNEAHMDSKTRDRYQYMLVHLSSSVTAIPDQDEIDEVLYKYDLAVMYKDPPPKIDTMRDDRYNALVNAFKEKMVIIRNQFELAENDIIEQDFQLDRARQVYNEYIQRFSGKPEVQATELKDQIEVAREAIKSGEYGSVMGIRREYLRIPGAMANLLNIDMPDSGTDGNTLGP